MDKSKQARLDAEARANGYPNYEAMRAFLLRRSQPRSQQTTNTTIRGSANNALNAHPKNLLSKAADAMRQAREKRKN